VELLKNRAYIGEYRAFDSHSRAKWAVLEGGQVKTAKRQDKPRKVPPSEWVVIPEHHPAIIDPDLFAAVQAKLKGNRKNSAPRGGGTGHLLGRRLLACGHCGAWMMGIHRPVRGTQVRWYTCAGHHAYGNCTHRYIQEAELLPLIADALQTGLL